MALPHTLAPASKASAISWNGLGSYLRSRGNCGILYTELVRMRRRQYTATFQLCLAVKHEAVEPSSCWNLFVRYKRTLLDDDDRRIAHQSKPAVSTVVRAPARLDCVN